MYQNDPTLVFSEKKTDTIIFIFIKKKKSIPTFFLYKYINLHCEKLQFFYSFHYRDYTIKILYKVKKNTSLFAVKYDYTSSAGKEGI